MESVGAIIFLPRGTTNEKPLLLENLLFSPAALWLAEALRNAGVDQFFVACHEEDQAEAAACFPIGTEFAPVLGADGGKKLLAFLSQRHGKVVVITRPALLSDDSARHLLTDNGVGAQEDRDTGVCRIHVSDLISALERGLPMETALLENGDRPNGRCVWFQGAYPMRTYWDGRMEAEMVARQYGAWRVMATGARLLDPNSVYVDPTVTVGAGTVLLPGTILRGRTIIGENCEIGPNSMLKDCILGDRVTVNSSQVCESTVGTGAKVGPFAYIRPNCRVGKNVKVGDFVELKNSNIGGDTKISHLTYVGDSDVGSNVNIGCGTVTVNYDGSAKFRTTIGDNAFIGCNTNLVAPVKVGNGAYTAAGSTITDDVPDDSLAIARSAQIIKVQWAAKRRKPKTKK